MKGNLFIISSPSGGGKNTLIKELLKNISRVCYSISFTTRKIRKGEKNGRDYFFVSKREFENLIEQSEFLEHAEVHGNFYGTSKARVKEELAAGNDVIIDIDVQGAKIIRKKIPRAASIFILPPSYEILSERLKIRNTETQEALTVRLNNAKQEIKAFKIFDYIIVNDELERASDKLKAIFLAERLRRDRQIGEIHDILASFENS